MGARSFQKFLSEVQEEDCHLTSEKSDCSDSDECSAELVELVELHEKMHKYMSRYVYFYNMYKNNLLLKCN